MQETSRIAEITAERVDLAMARPFESAKRRSTVSEVVRVTARLHSGAEGRGEASPAAYVTGEDAVSLQLAIAAATTALVGQPADRPRLWLDRLQEARDRGSSPPHSRRGLARRRVAVVHPEEVSVAVEGNEASVGVRSGVHVVVRIPAMRTATRVWRP